MLKCSYGAKGISVGALDVLKFCDDELVIHPRSIQCHWPSHCKSDRISFAPGSSDHSQYFQFGWNQRPNLNVVDAKAFYRSGVCSRSDRRRLDYRSSVYVAIDSILLVRKINKET